MKPYRYIKLSEAEEAVLSEGYKFGGKSHFRIRCHSLLLSHQGYRIEQIASIQNKRLETVRDWMNDWELQGIKGLEIQKGRGRKPALSLCALETVELVKKKLKNTPSN